MGVVNATPDSFSDDGAHRTLDERVELARALLDAGAGIIDIGGESGRTDQPPVEAEEEIERVVPLIERVTGELGALVSVDTYKPAVAFAAIGAGAAIVNDVSGLRDPELADVCAGTGAGLVLMHTRAAPKDKLLDPTLDGLVGADVKRFLRELISVAMAHGVSFEQLMLDPGPDFGKTPAQTVEVLRELPGLHALGRPLLLAVSRKDFIGAITSRPPRTNSLGSAELNRRSLAQRDRSPPIQPKEAPCRSWTATRLPLARSPTFTPLRPSSRSTATAGCASPS
jgi:dihydropteroate synthase